MQNAISGALLASKTGYFRSKLIQCEKYSYHGFEVLFDEKVILRKNTRYCLCAKIRGRDSLCGGDGVSSVKCGDVTFTFFMDEGFEYVSFNGTQVQQG